MDRGLPLLKHDLPSVSVALVDGCLVDSSSWEAGYPVVWDRLLTLLSGVGCFVVVGHHNSPRRLGKPARASHNLSKRHVTGAFSRKRNMRHRDTGSKCEWDEEEEPRGGMARPPFSWRPRRRFMHHDVRRSFVHFDGAVRCAALRSGVRSAVGAAGRRDPGEVLGFKYRAERAIATTASRGCSRRSRSTVFGCSLNKMELFLLG